MGRFSNLHYRTFNKAAGLQTSNFIKKGLFSYEGFLRTAFSIELLRCLLLCLLVKAGEESVEQISQEKCFK